MTVDDVKARIEKISACAADDERAHILEDDLRRDVLRAIAAGVPNPRALAAAALQSEKIDFARWCA